MFYSIKYILYAIFVVISFVILHILCIFASENIQQQQQSYNFYPNKQTKSKEL